MCIPYARRKSHKSRTSERGGVQAENVSTASNQQRRGEDSHMERHIFLPEDF